MKIKINVLRVFVNGNGEFGNPVGIITDESQKISVSARQKIATILNFSESVFVDNLAVGNLQIFNPVKEVKFAGHALVGTAYFLNTVLGKTVPVLRCLKGEVKTDQENGFTWIKSDLNGTPPWNFEQLDNAALVKSFPQDKMRTAKHLVIWAWINKDARVIYARTFAPDWGIPEDQANGSGAMQLSKKLAQRLEIHQGLGSVIFAKPEANDLVSVGGKIVVDKTRVIEI
jgi:predicted PhzF superfamily epimerase YddE/YHI9